MKTVLVLGLVFATGCGKDEDSSDKNGNGNNSSGQTVPDPEGTVLVTIANNGKNLYFDGGNPVQGGYISIGSDNLYMSYANNFHSDEYIASVGKVKGLGEIIKIPTSGFVRVVSVEPSYGYVIQIGKNSNTYARLYVVEWVKSTSGGIIGAKVKYQYPFNP